MEKLGSTDLDDDYALREGIEEMMEALLKLPRKSAERTLAYRSLQQAHFHLGLDALQLEPDAHLVFPKPLPERK